MSLIVYIQLAENKKPDWEQHAVGHRFGLGHTKSKVLLPYPADTICPLAPENLPVYVRSHIF